MRTFSARSILVAALIGFLSLQQVTAEAGAIGSHRFAIVLSGRSFAYDVQAASLKIIGEAAGSSADVFYVAYRARFESIDANRPIIFAYNGGPGGSSAGVHIGAFGPRVVAPVEAGRLPAISDRLVDNPDTLLRYADLVFIDPVGSGLSRLSGGTSPSSFYGVRADAAATATFIRNYLSQHSEGDRPFFILGESYGTLRSVLAARLLQEQGDKPAGLILLGLILDNSTLFAQPGNDEPYWLFLPSEAATARFHGRAGGATPVADIVAAAEDFAHDRYLLALASGTALSPEAQRRVSDTLTGLLGMSADDIRVGPDRFAHDLLGKGMILSRADGRFAGLQGGTGVLADPLYNAMLPLYGRVMTRYLRDQLGVAEAEDYRVLDTSVADAWQWGDTALGSPTALSVGGTLRVALHADPDLSVFVASGIYDLTSPMLAADYTLTHLGTSPAETARITSRRYESGHMIYVSAAARRQLARDIGGFIGSNAMARRAAPPS